MCFLLFPQSRPMLFVARSTALIIKSRGKRSPLVIQGISRSIVACFSFASTFFAIGTAFCNVRRGRRTNKDNFLDLGLLPSSVGSSTLRYSSCHWNVSCQSLYIGKQLRALQFLIVPDGQPARCSRIQNHDRRLGIVLQLVLIPPRMARLNCRAISSWVSAGNLSVSSSKSSQSSPASGLYPGQYRDIPQHWVLLRSSSPKQVQSVPLYLPFFAC